MGIADSRLVAFEDGRVSLRYKDYKSGGEIRTMTLPAADFAKRFLAHVLPNGLMRIRYRFLANLRHPEGAAMKRSPCQQIKVAADARAKGQGEVCARKTAVSATKTGDGRTLEDSIRGWRWYSLAACRESASAT